MASQSTADHERETKADESTGADVLPRVKRAFGDGFAALLVGGTLLLGSLRTRGRGGRTALQGVAGLALIWVGLQQRRADDGTDLSIETDDEAGDGDVSAEAEAEVSMPLHNVDQQAKGNPRDVSKEPDIETAEDEGDIQFNREQETEPRQVPDLDEEEVGDPRQNDEMGDEADVEIDISEAAMADEPNEAAGPTSEQSQPTTTKDEDTVPEDGATITEDASDMQADPDDEPGDESEDEERETVESEGGAEIHTDTMEAGTMDIDEDDVTDPEDDLNEEPADSEQQSNPRLEDDESETEN